MIISSSFSILIFLICSHERGGLTIRRCIFSSTININGLSWLLRVMSKIEHIRHIRIKPVVKNRDVIFPVKSCSLAQNDNRYHPQDEGMDGF